MLWLSQCFCLYYHIDTSYLSLILLPTNKKRTQRTSTFNGTALDPVVNFCCLLHRLLHRSEQLEMLGLNHSGKCEFVYKYTITIYTSLNIWKYILELLSLQNMFWFGRKVYIDMGWSWNSHRSDDSLATVYRYGNMGTIIRLCFDNINGYTI